MLERVQSDSRTINRRKATNPLIFRTTGNRGNKVLRFITFTISLMLSINVSATAQAPDYLIYEGEKYRLHVNPLEELFQENEELKPKVEIIFSANWRGYVATFSINHNALVISDITVIKSNPNKKHSYVTESILLEVFPKESDRRLDWFSGLLVVPLGEKTGYVHLSYASQYENYLLFRIGNGQVLESVEMELEEYMDFKTRQFEIFKDTPEYETIYRELSEGRQPGDDFDLEGFIFQMGEFTHKINIPFMPPSKSSNLNDVSNTDS